MARAAQVGRLIGVLWPPSLDPGLNPGVCRSVQIKPHIIRGRFTVAGWSAHDLRRTVRTHWAAMGCPDRLAEHMLGHVDSSIEGVYNRHSYRSERVEWLQKLDQRWEAALARVVEKHGPFTPWRDQS